jgi:hypothetical protein
MRRALLLTALSLAVATPAVAAPLNPWGVHVGRKVFALTPFLYVDQSPGLYPLLYGQYGFTDNFELLFGAGGEVYPGTPTTGGLERIEVMPRQFFNDTSGMALHLIYLPGSGDISAAPEFHGAYEFGSFALTVNAGGSVGIGVSSQGQVAVAGDIYAYIAPEWYFNDATSVFLEIDPTLTLTGIGTNPAPLALEVVPGVSTAIAETHYFALGVGIPITGFDPTGIYGGIWYSTSFGGE